MLSDWDALRRTSNASSAEIPRRSMFQDEVLQPYRDRGRPADERARLAAALAQLKPITVRGVVTAFGRAVNRTIRQRLA